MIIDGVDYLQRVDLIQDLRFETTTTKIKATLDGEFLIALGASKLIFILIIFCDRKWVIVYFYF